jgi:hypothetical protein
MDGFALEPQKLEAGDASLLVAVKGEYPSLYYPFALKELYATLPSLDAEGAYEQIRWLLARVDRVVADDLKLRTRLGLPATTDKLRAGAILGALFDPSIQPSDMLSLESATWPGVELTQILQLQTPRPFPLQRASSAKLQHSLCWIDTNLKVQIENVMLRQDASPEQCRLVAECALCIYTYLLKQEDNSLARTINFNHSMFLQDRILSLIFGPSHYSTGGLGRGRSLLANHIALRYLKELGSVSYRDLCTLSVFMGTIWTSHVELQTEYRSRAWETLARVERELKIRERQWCVNDIDQFLLAMGRDTPQSVLVVLDDNGEAVFDLAIFQRLLQDNAKLSVTFLVNSYPVSNNISLDALNDVAQDDYFHYLRSRLDSGDAALCIEEQPFRSFELEYLKVDTQQAVADADVLYIKGANFFETFQIRKKDRWHCFVVHDMTSEMLTGCTRDQGVFVGLDPGQDGYIYRSAHDVSTLLEIVARGASHAP